MQSTKASLRYAKAIFNLAKEQNIVDQLLLDFKSLAAIINEKTELFSLIKDPTIKHQKKIKLFQKVFDSKLHTTTMQFLILVLKKGRESMLSQMLDKYTELYNKEKGIVLAEIISSKPISEELKENIKQKISSDRKVELKETIDKSILGGFIINSGDLQYDASIRKKINNVKRAFKL
jgi:F-type H+-transporting ATPase subunit delta